MQLCMEEHCPQMLVLADGTRMTIVSSQSSAIEDDEEEQVMEEFEEHEEVPNLTPGTDSSSGSSG